MKLEDSKAELKYRFCVIMLDTLYSQKVIKEKEYDQIRKSLSQKIKAPIGMLEAEDIINKNVLIYPDRTLSFEMIDGSKKTVQFPRWTPNQYRGEFSI